MDPGTKVRKSEIVRIQSVRFLCEQDGPPERELKNELASLFGRANWVTVAYLARVLLDQEAGSGVALCVRGQPGQDRAFAAQVGKIFGSLFGSHEHLDILWLQPQQEVELAKVCKPFWTSIAGRRRTIPTSQ